MSSRRLYQVDWVAVVLVVTCVILDVALLGILGSLILKWILQ